MKIVNKIKSWDGSKDCFGYGNPTDVDHIYPKSLGGSDIEENRQRLSIVANEAKKNKTKGQIDNEWRFSIVKVTTEDQLIYGKMYIRKKSFKHDEWWEVIPSK